MTPYLKSALIVIALMEIVLLLIIPNLLSSTLPTIPPPPPPEESRWNPTVFYSELIPDSDFVIVRFNDSTYTWAYDRSYSGDYPSFKAAEREALIAYKLYKQ